MQAVAHTANETATLNANAVALPSTDHIGVASELVTESGTFRTVAELTAHCHIGYYNSAVCYRSKYNVRPAATDLRENVRELAQLIAHQGLLQNLIGYIDADGKVAIVAGERRRNAIAFNIEEGLLPDDFAIPVLIITEAEAVAVSLAENSGRQAMHHADVSQAVLDLHKAGASVADIAVCFGLEEVIVRRRLRLAALSPVIFDHYRKDEMNFDQVVAYTLVEDHAQQEAALAVVGVKGAPHQVRALLTSQKRPVNDGVVQFVGLDNYKAAGGDVVSDLFDAYGHVGDVVLLEKLALDKLETTAAGLRAEGHAWVECKLSMTHADLDQYARARIETRAASTEELEAMAALDTKIEEIESKIEALEDAEDYGSDEHVALSAELDALDAQRTVIKAGLTDIIADDKPLAGALVFVKHGKLEMLTGLIKPEDKKSMKKQPKATGSNGQEAPTRALHSEALMHNLTTHRTFAVRAELMDRPDVAIVLATHGLMTRAFSSELRSWSRDSASSLSWDTASLDEDARTGKAALAVKARHEELAALLPTGMNAEKLLPWLVEQEQATVWKLFAYCSALSFDFTARKESEKSKYFGPIAQMLSLDMANWWEAKDDYFGRVSLARIVEVVKTVSTEAAARISTMKKRDAVIAAIEATKDKRWLPDFFRN